MLDQIADGLSNLRTPAILFFGLGLVAAALRSDLKVPEPMSKGMALYLMVAIGLKGGAAVSATPASALLPSALAAGIVLSCLLPLPAFALLRLSTGLDRATAAAVAGHYGSVSVVTYVAATQLLQARGLVPEPFMPAVLAAMEAPGIAVALLLARPGAGGLGPALRSVLLHGAVVVLVGSFFIGWASGAERYAPIRPFSEGLFAGILCLFLLDMGLLAGRQLMETPGLDKRLLIFAVAMPLVGAACGLFLGAAIGLGAGGTAMLGVLAASASYIAAPAAMRTALPEANPGIYVPLALGVTFPFNLLVGIPLYAAVAAWMGPA